MYNAHSVGSSSHFFVPDNHHCRKCATKIRRVVACEAVVFDTLASHNQARYWLVRNTSLAEQLPDLTQHIYGKGTGPPNDNREAN